MLRILFISCLIHFYVESKANILPPELIARKGIPNFLWKLKHKKDTVTVAYLGGSITEADNGWREQTQRWLQKQYPNIAFKQIDAAIGGTNSVLGVYRLNEHVLKYKPDLLFVEFAVNDDDNSREEVLTSMEGIVRKTWQANAKTDIVFVYTFAGYLLKNYNKEGVPPTVKTMEELADHYHIPSINLSPKIVQLINDKKLYISGKQPFINDSTFFSADGIHPFPKTGHSLYTESIVNAINNLSAIGKRGKHHLPAAYYSRKLERATMMNISPGMLSGNAETISGINNVLINRYSRFLSDALKLNDSTAVLSFSFTGESIGFLDIIGPSSSQLTVLIDKDPPRYIDRFDKYCFYTRLHFFFIEGLENKRHEIRVRLSPMKMDKFSILEKKPSAVEMPNQYSEYSWLVARILLNGKFIPNK